MVEPSCFWALEWGFDGIATTASRPGEGEKHSWVVPALSPGMAAASVPYGAVRAAHGSGTPWFSFQCMGRWELAMRERFGRVVGVPGSPSALQCRQLVSCDPPNGPKSSLASSCGRGFLGEPLPLFSRLQTQPSVTGGLSRALGRAGLFTWGQ